MKKLKVNSEDIKKWEEETSLAYPRREYCGIYEAALHAEITLDYMTSEEGKKILTEEFGELEALEQIRKKEKELKMRRAELLTLKKAFLKNG